jgi:LacI family fructose operon transcriptional repressor
VISDNYGAKALTHKILANSARRRGALAPLTFIGGRSGDHNTRERLRGFHDAHREQGLVVPQENILAPGYSKGKVEACLQERFATAKTPLPGLFVNSTISLEGVVRWLSQAGLTGSEQPPMGCFDWDRLSICWGTISTWCSRTCRRCWKRCSDY